MTPLRELKTLFSVPDARPALWAAQLRALKLQVPILYVILSINSIALAYTHVHLAPLALVIVPIAVMIAFAAHRIRTWVRLDLTAIPVEHHPLLLRKTNRLCAFLGPAYLSWALSLLPYSDNLGRFHVFFYVAITTIACVFCLMHLRSAALIVTLSVIGPFTLFVLLQGESTLTAVAINQVLVAGVMVFMLLVYYRDFTRLAGQNETLEALGAENLRLASTDMLTGLPNRRSFFPTLEEALRACEVEGDTCAVGLVDLDGFKAVNDTYGHVTGDRVLREVAGRLSGALAATTSLARLGGDEFGLIVRGEVTDAALSAVSDAVVAALEPPFALGGSTVQIGASVGFARFPEAGTTAARLMECADFALYHAKDHRRGTGVLFSREHELRLSAQGAIEHALRCADMPREFTLAFQPIIDMRTRRPVALEALARWHSPLLGTIPPDRFVAAAERTGLINALTRVLLVKALAALAEWPPAVRLSFNLSMADITSPEAVTQLCTLVRESGVDPTRLQFEATETAMIQDFAQAQVGLTRLKATGASIALDDFGTGYSSLSYLHRLPIDRLKIDKSFTSELLTCEPSRNIVGSIVELSRRLGMDCVVEGVETPAQAELVSVLGGRLVQGYLFHRPMPAEEAGAYLRDLWSADGGAAALVSAA